MRRVHSLLGAIIPILYATVAASAGPSSTPTHYRVVHGWPQLPAGEILGQATGVGVDSKQDVWVFHRAGREWSDPMPEQAIDRPTIVQFDGRTGKRLRSWGANSFVMPHGLTIDGADNVWVTDVGTHQVFKYSPTGRLLMTLGERRVSGSDRTHFNLPTDVAVLRDGSFYVSDGYQNTRVVKFSSDGKYQFEWGKKGGGPGEFDLPHGIALDAAGRVYVADRSNARVQIFTPTGEYVSEWKGPAFGRPYSVAIAAMNRAVVVDGGDQPESGADRSGAVFVNLEGRPLNRFGRFGNQDGQFRLAHDVAVDRAGKIYVVDVRGQRVQKFIRR